VVRSGLHSALKSAGFLHIQQAATYAEASTRLSTEPFHLAIIDQHLGDGEGIDLAIVAGLSNPECKLVLLTLEEQWQLIEQARLLGFGAFLSKRTELVEIISTMTKLLRDAPYFYLRVPQIPQYPTISHERSIHLTKTEAEVLADLSDGSSTKEIALRRCNSEATIKSHLSSIYRKLGARNRIEALIIARDFNLIHR
jgi:DNA-binding NarL/FixJ family response regulator